MEMIRSSLRMRWSILRCEWLCRFDHSSTYEGPLWNCLEHNDIECNRYSIWTFINCQCNFRTHTHESVHISTPASRCLCVLFSSSSRNDSFTLRYFSFSCCSFFLPSLSSLSLASLLIESSLDSLTIAFCSQHGKIRSWFFYMGLRSNRCKTFEKQRFCFELLNWQKKRFEVFLSRYSRIFFLLFLLFSTRSNNKNCQRKQRGDLWNIARCGSSRCSTYLLFETSSKFSTRSNEEERFKVDDDQEGNLGVSFYSALLHHLHQHHWLLLLLRFVHQHQLQIDDEQHHSAVVKPNWDMIVGNMSCKAKRRSVRWFSLNSLRHRTFRVRRSTDRKGVRTQGRLHFRIGEMNHFSVIFEHVHLDRSCIRSLNSDEWSSHFFNALNVIRSEFLQRTL